MDLLTTHNKMLQTQIAQQASSSTTPPGSLPSKPQQNPREQCNAIMLRSGTPLEGPKGASVHVESQKEYDRGVVPLPGEKEPKEWRENERLKESRTLSLKPYMAPPSHFHKGLIRLSLILSLASFLICLKSCMLKFLS